MKVLQIFIEKRKKADYRDSPPFSFFYSTRPLKNSQSRSRVVEAREIFDAAGDDADDDRLIAATGEGFGKREIDRVNARLDENRAGRNLRRRNLRAADADDEIARRRAIDARQKDSQNSRHASAAATPERSDRKRLARSNGVCGINDLRASAGTGNRQGRKHTGTRRNNKDRAFNDCSVIVDNQRISCIGSRR